MSGDGPNTPDECWERATELGGEMVRLNHALTKYIGECTRKGRQMLPAEERHAEKLQAQMNVVAGAKEAALDRRRMLLSERDQRYENYFIKAAHKLLPDEMYQAVEREARERMASEQARRGLGVGSAVPVVAGGGTMRERR